MSRKPPAEPRRRKAEDYFAAFNTTTSLLRVPRATYSVFPSSDHAYEAINPDGKFVTCCNAPLGLSIFQIFEAPCRIKLKYRPCPSGANCGGPLPLPVTIGKFVVAGPPLSCPLTTGYGDFGYSKL